MDGEGTRLGAAVAALARARRNQAVPAGLRQEVLAYAATKRKAGASWQAIAHEVGISASGLKRWSDLSVRTPTRMRRVRVRGDGGLGVAATPPRALTLVLPSGLRVEGLSREDAAVLVRELGA